ncbi:hypothetical protein ACSHT2_13970 [Bradyrhizobium sp. PUT101]|uniref:hypothetical protein n=1 Tax=Bradyrhizobium sp. PUT101 TaxID=3447427 RepID=UPI003F83B3F4
MPGIHVTKEQARAYERRRARHRREWVKRREGSEGPAGPCRRISPEDSVTVLGVVERPEDTGPAERTRQRGSGGPQEALGAEDGPEA